MVRCSIISRRLAALRLSKDVPNVVQAIEAGKLNLASQVGSFLRNEEKVGKSYSPEQKADLLQKMESKSTRECERELLALSRQSMIPPERARAATGTSRIARNCKMAYSSRQPARGLICQANDFSELLTYIRFPLPGITRCASVRSIKKRR